jgi:hypothetical protein
MSGFRRLAFTARTSRLCACTKVIALCRVSRIARAHDRGSRLRHRLDAPRLHHICAAKLEICQQRSHPLVRAANALHPYPTVTTTAIGPVRDLEAALDGPLDLVATSGLLDLVSYSWLKRLAIESRCAGFRSMQRYLTTARSPLSLRILSMRRSPRRSATTNVATRDWDQHSARMS